MERKMDLIIASNNKDKVRELKNILSKYFSNIYSLSDKEIDIEIEETGNTFEENALIKSRTIRDLTGCASLGDDSGLVVDALNGAPGVYSARYAGEDCNYINNQILLLKNLKNEKNRKAHFETCVALSLPNGKDFTATGITRGRILEEPIGGNGFGYDAVFFSDTLQMSFAQATMEEKNKISHRANALSNLLPVLNRELKK